MESPAGSARAAALAADVEAAAAAVADLLTDVPPDRWAHVPGPGVWSIGKEAEHLSEAAVYHQWIVRLTIGERVASRRPSIERSRLTTGLSPQQAIALILDRANDGATLVRAVTNEQLDLPTRPPRARDQPLAETIERVLIGHYRSHRDSIAAKLRDSEP